CTLSNYTCLLSLHDALPILAQRLDSSFKNFCFSYEDDEGASAGSRRRLSPKAPQLVPAEVANEKNKLLPSDYFRKNFYWTIETEDRKSTRLNSSHQIISYAV